MRTPSLETPVLYYRSLCDLLTEKGHDCAPWLEAAAIDPKALDNPDGLVSVAQIDRLIGEMELGTGRRDWGFVLGKRITLTSHGSVGFAMITSRTLGDLLQVCARYYRLMNPLYFLEVGVDGDVACAHWRKAGSLPARTRNFIEEIIAVSAYQQILPFLKTSPGTVEIRLAQAAPAHASLYAELSQAKVRFSDVDSGGVSVYFSARNLDSPNPLANPGGLVLAEEICRRKVAELDRLGGWHEWVTRALRSAEGLRPTQAELAKLMHMSPRTLERALARENTSYSEIGERVGHERACEMLTEGRLAVSDIARQLGYRNISAFSRAFRRRSGLSPSEFAEQTRNIDRLYQAGGSAPR